MKDPEFIELRNKFFIGVLVALLFSVPLIIFFYKNNTTSNVNKMLNEKKSFVVVVESNDCSKCELLEETLDIKNIEYKIINSNKTKDYSLIMQKLGILNENKKFPILVVVEEGKMKANLFDIQSKKDINEFLKFHNIK